MSLIYTHNSSPRRYKKVIKSKSYREAVEKQRKYLRSLGIDPDRKIEKKNFRVIPNWYDTRNESVVQPVRTPACHAGGRGFESHRPRQKSGATKPHHNWRLEESKKFTVAPAYNKGAYQVITKNNIKDIGR